MGITLKEMTPLNTKDPSKKITYPVGTQVRTVPSGTFNGENTYILYFPNDEMACTDTSFFKFLLPDIEETQAQKLERLMQTIVNSQEGITEILLDVLERMNKLEASKS